VVRGGCREATVCDRRRPVLGEGRSPGPRRSDERRLFEHVPAGGDAYIMKLIIHDWDDARAAQSRNTAAPL